MIRIKRIHFNQDSELKLGRHYKKGRIELFLLEKQFQRYNIFYGGIYIGKIEQCQIEKYESNSCEDYRIPFLDKDYIGGSAIVFKKLRDKIFLSEILFNMNMSSIFTFEKKILLEKYKELVQEETVGDIL